MIRFVDLGKQIGGDDEDWDREFAFYNTVSDRFINFGGSQIWATVSDFESDYKKFANNDHPLERFLSLIPDWVAKD